MKGTGHGTSIHDVVDLGTRLERQRRRTKAKQYARQMKAIFRKNGKDTSQWPVKLRNMLGIRGE